MLVQNYSGVCVWWWIVVIYWQLMKTISSVIVLNIRYCIELILYLFKLWNCLMRSYGITVTELVAQLIKDLLIPGSNPILAMFEGISCLPLEVISPI